MKKVKRKYGNFFGFLMSHKLKSKREKIPKAQMERFFPPDEQEVYYFAKWYAGVENNSTRIYCDGKIITSCETEEDSLVGQELRIFLSPSDWCRFQSQSFYLDLMEYLNNLKTQKEVKHLGMPQS